MLIEKKKKKVQAWPFATIFFKSVGRLIYSILFTSWLNILKVSHLEALVEQRDKEIRILVAKLRRAREGLGDTVISDTTSKFSHSSSEAPSNTIEMNPEQKKKLLEEYKRVSQVVRHFVDIMKH